MIILIAAMGENGVIGVDNALPWSIPADLKHFKDLTSGHPIVMGRKTFESLGRPLPNRQNIVITRQADYDADGADIVSSIADALDVAMASEKDIYIIGGAEIYSQTLGIAERLEITKVAAAPDGDAFFPIINEEDWIEVARSDFPADGDTPAYSFLTFERR